jgi:uncharacterized FlaG/YvyC family protein
MPVAAATPPLTLSHSDGNPVAGLDAAQTPVPPGALPVVGGSANPQKAGDQELRKAVKDANAALAANGTQLVFVFDDQTHHFAVKLLDIQTQKIVQELLPAAMRATASALSGSAASGALVDTKA